MKLAGFAGAILLAMAGSAQAQIVEAPPADARDKIAPAGTGEGDEAEPWWVLLADCAALFRAVPEDPTKFRAFGAAAMGQVAKDRGILARDAGPVVMPYIMKGQGAVRAATLIGIYGGATELRARCDSLMVKYKAL